MAGRSSTVRTALTAALAALVLVLVLVPVASAGKGQGGASTSSSLALVMVNDLNEIGLPNWGDTVTFSVSTTATSQPSVIADCYQNGVLVYRHYGFFYGDPSPSQNFVLQSAAWTSGAADCSATLYYMNKKPREVDLATLPFHVDA